MSTLRVECATFGRVRRKNVLLAMLANEKNVFKKTCSFFEMCQRCALNVRPSVELCNKAGGLRAQRQQRRAQCSWRSQPVATLSPHSARTEVGSVYILPTRCRPCVRALRPLLHQSPKAIHARAQPVTHERTNCVTYSSHSRAGASDTFKKRNVF